MVSVIIPVYNSGKYLRECLESVLSQTFRELEVICINDGSNDESSNILKNYMKKDARIKIINNPINKGLSYARNRGSEVARGEYLYFLDADDTLTSFALEELYYYAKEKRADIVFFDSKMLKESDNFVISNEGEFCANVNYGDVMKGADFLEKMQMENNLRIPVWLQFWNRSSFQKMKMNFLENELHEDWLFTYMGLVKAERVFCVNKIYHFYRRHDDSISIGRFNEGNIRSLLKIYTLIINFWSESKDREIDKITWKYLDSLQHTILLNVIKKELNLERLRNAWGEHSLYIYLLDRMIKINNVEYIDKKELKRLYNAEKIFVYGAGKMAEKCILNMKSYDISVSGIAVTETLDNPENLLGIKIFNIMDLVPFKKKCIIVIGVGQRFRNEVISKLEKLGFDYCKPLN